ncbi:MAG TPA: GNAT family N-acetyltransferase [Longimicrobium sp.]|jgi:GNAT superfamily N-acetyltransferase
MSDRFGVRRATAADAEALARQRAEMFREIGGLAEELYAPLVAASRAFYERAIPAGEYVAWVAVPAERPDEVAASAGVQLRALMPRPTADGRLAEAPVQGWIVNVYTEPAWRRGGLAEGLMRELLAWAREAGVDDLVLHTTEDGRPLYERLGFVPVPYMRFSGEPY